jgi:hypothetical protein
VFCSGARDGGGRRSDEIVDGQQRDNIEMGVLQRVNPVVKDDDDGVGVVQPSFIRSRRERGTAPATAPQVITASNANNARPDFEPCPVFDLDYRPEGDGRRMSNASLYDVPDSNVQNKTVEFGDRLGTTESSGDGVAMRVTRYRVRSRSW